MKYWLLLIAAVLSEVAGTTALKLSDGFTRTVPSLVVVVGYGAAFYFLSLTLKAIPIGIAYAVWSGIGIVSIGLIGWLWFGQSLDRPALFGISLILAGVLVLNVFSKSAH